MAVTECPHCDAGIDSVARTGDKRYACSACNMVISYDDLRPHLDDLEVIDKRKPDNPPENQQNQQSNSNNNQQPANPPETIGQQDTSLSDREKIYQRGQAGLKEIKRERLKNWLGNTEGVGGQTESRILMVFERNETIHQNPHILYNLLDDELNASSSYINTMVEDIFSPERENEDLLQKQGYTPWFRRNNAMPSGGSVNGGGQAYNATGQPAAGFSGAGGQPQGGMGGQQQQRPPERGQQDQPRERQQDNSIDRKEAEMMVSEALEREREQGGSNPLREGLSDATDTALQEMATNVGGLAGTVQRVIDEALVSYARENPEWVVENMGIVQKVLGAANDADTSDGDTQKKEAESDTQVDQAISDISRGSNNQSPNERSEPSNSGGLAGFGSDNTDVSKSESAFEPSEETVKAASSEPPEVEDAPPEPKPKPSGGASEQSENIRDNFESEDVDDKRVDEGEETSEDEFETIFGDVAE